MYVLDPNIFGTDEFDDHHDKLIRTLYNWTCNKKSRLLNFAIAWDEIGILEEEYKRFINHKAKGINGLIPKLVSNLLVNQPIHTGMAPLSPKLEELLKECSKVCEVMILMAVNEPQLTVVLSDTNLNIPSTLRREICQVIGREAILYVSEFNQRLFIRTEGKTDWKHIKAALLRYKQMGKYLGLCIDFDEFEDIHKPTKENPHKGGDEILFAFCRYTAETPRIMPIICIFDADNQTMVTNISNAANLPGKYKHWGNDLYTFALPTPKHRQEMHGDICIEFYYIDENLRQCDSEGRRLYLNTEFSPTSGRHKSPLNMIGKGPTTKNGNQIFIFSGKVLDMNDSNVALSKDDFASYIMELAPPFDCFDISAFDLIFEVITSIKNQIIWEY